ncbi:hypothetical protein BDW42DRAFT_196687 [Aspergillus taichungensis]|uniref:Uncharacterized protein n=1 Tax=Aspergillus taichungensis TaxID=482145 RepID=A0A2J5HJX0_9EURO|nr:hypothetical protein BDW42DRAFT_196687 [Aspergillus taichungensis]
MHTTTFTPETTLYLTIPNSEPHDTNPWYTFVPLLGQFTDPELLSMLVRYTATIERPRYELQLCGDLSKRGGVWIEVMVTPGCSPSDVVLRMFAGLSSMQDLVVDGDRGFGLLLHEGPLYGIDEFTDGRSGLGLEERLALKTGINMSRVRTFNAQTRLYLTITNEEFPREDSAWYLFLPILGDITDEQILIALMDYTTCIKMPEEELRYRHNANRYGGLWVEILTPLSCTQNDVILRLFSGLRDLQDFVGHGEFPGGLALLQSPAYGVEDFADDYPNMIVRKMMEEE